jgi:hypothetical protein
MFGRDKNFGEDEIERENCLKFFGVDQIVMQHFKTVPKSI